MHTTLNAATSSAKSLAPYRGRVIRGLTPEGDWHSVLRNDLVWRKDLVLRKRRVEAEIPAEIT
jgi:hypothetical protein